MIVVATTWPDGSPRSCTDIEWELSGSAFCADGVFGRPADPTTIFADSTGRQVKIRAGKYAMVHGQGWSSGTTDIVVSIGANATSFSRYDLIVLGLDRSTWLASVYPKQGTAAASPTVPALQRDAAGAGTGKWEIPLARVTVGPGVSTINSGDVVNYAQYLGPGEPVHVADVAALAYIPSPVANQLAYVVQLATIYRYTGTVWTPLQAGSILGGNNYPGTGALGTAFADQHYYLGMTTGVRQLIGGFRYAIEALPTVQLSAAADMRCWFVIGKGSTINTVHEELPVLSTAYTSQPYRVVGEYTPAADEQVEFRLWGRAGTANWFQAHRRQTTAGSVPYMRIRLLGAGVLMGDV